MFCIFQTTSSLSFEALKSQWVKTIPSGAFDHHGNDIHKLSQLNLHLQYFKDFAICYVSSLSDLKCWPWRVTPLPLRIYPNAIYIYMYIYVYIYIYVYVVILKPIADDFHVPLITNPRNNQFPLSLKVT